MQGMINDPKAALKFLLAGNATATFRSQKSGVHFTYKIEVAPKRANLPQAYFVMVLVGPDNTNDYAYLGMIGHDNRFFVTRNSKFPNGSCAVAMGWVMDHLALGEMPPMTEIFHEGRCGRCGRTLTVPESIETGIGPVCATQGM